MKNGVADLNNLKKRDFLVEPARVRPSLNGFGISLNFQSLSLAIMLFFQQPLPAQQAAPPLSEREALFQKLRGELAKGEKRALRDLAFFLDEMAFSENARRTFQYSTVFQANEINFSKNPGKQAVLNFYYQNIKELRYDELLYAWYLTPLEKTKLPIFETRPLPEPASPEKTQKSAALNLRLSLENGDTAAFALNLSTLAELKLDDAWETILAVAKDEKKLAAAPFPKKFQTRNHLMNALKYCPSDEAISLIFNWLQKDLVSPAEAEIPVSEISNHFINVVSKDGILGKIKPLFDSLSSLEALKNHGYRVVLPFEPLFFEETVDFFGHSLPFTWAQPWARNNAIESLLASRHPRCLFYLAARLFRARYDSDSFADARKFIEPYVNPIEKLTAQRLLVPNKNGSVLAESKDQEWLLNYVRYWALHWKDYEWDEKRGYFINKTRVETVGESFERNFKRLSAENDSVAMLAYRQLAEGNPDKIEPLVEQFRQTIRNFNPSVPSFKYHYLENLSRLSDFCRDNGFSWKPDEKLQKKLELLASEISPTDRYRLENQLIASLNLNDLTALEFEAIFRESNRDFSFSIARILDALYLKTWTEVLKDDKQLRLFLKKTALFSRFGASGACNYYENKFSSGDSTTAKKLQWLASHDADDDVLKSSNSILKKTYGASFSKPSEDGGGSPPRNEKKLQPIENEQVAKMLFWENIEKLKQADSLNAEVFNLIFASGFYIEAEHKAQVLAAIPKIKPASQLRRLLPNPKFSIRSDFPFFKNISLKTNELHGIARLFNGDAPEILLAYFWEKTDSFDSENRGAFFNEVLKTDYFRRFLDGGKADAKLVTDIKNTIANWSANSENVSEFEEQIANFHLFLIENAGLPLEKKLEKIFALSAETSTRFHFQKELLAGISFADLKKIAHLIPQLLPEENGTPGWFFLVRDFGLPPFDFSERIENQSFVNLLNTFSEAELYKFYLRKFWVQIEDGRTRKLDFQAIHQILKADLISPFAGSGGERRDWYIFGVVKVLETEFGTRLGFHEKLNENQTFYTFTAGKRAAAWADFLEKKGLAKPGLGGKTWNK